MSTSVYLIPSVPADKEQSAQGEAFLEFYKLEYERAAIRYNDIYQIGWTIFNYSALVAGGILTFGFNIIEEPNLPGLLACVPLFFWYMTTFIPMNRYGDQVGLRLAQIESEVKERFPHVDLKHFIDFQSRAKKTFSEMLTRPSVRAIVFIFFSLLFLASISFVVNITSYASESLLKTSDIKSPAGLLKVFREQNPDRPLDGYLQGRLSANTKKQVGEYNPSAPPSKALQKALLYDLNLVLEGENIYEPQRFKNVYLSDETKNLKEHLNSSEDIVRLNRVLLEDAYPQVLVRSSRSEIVRKGPLLFLFILPVIFFYGLLIGCLQIFKRKQLGDQPRKVIAVEQATGGTTPPSPVKLKAVDLASLGESIVKAKENTAMRIAALTLEDLTNKLQAEEIKDEMLVIGLEETPGGVKLSAIKMEELKKQLLEKAKK
jgi:hypothetical protein